MTKTILRPHEVRAKLGLSRATINRLRARGEFPQPISLGRQANGYYEHEIDEWLEARAANRPAPKSAAA